MVCRFEVGFILEQQIQGETSQSGLELTVQDNVGIFKA
jgi:hypothetical protein